MPERDYDAVLLRYAGRGIRPDLGPFKAALLELGLDCAYRRILIAGTNGKGSTAAMVANALHLAGLNVGLLTSPHLVDVRERIQLNGTLISETDFAQCFEALLPTFEKWQLTYYESIVLLGFYYFSQQKVEVAVLEVGMGGRFDATNALDPHLTAITTVDFDHQQYLGNTLAEIATEKAGITRPGVPLVSGVVQDEAQDRLMAICREHKVPYIQAPKLETDSLIPKNLPGEHQRHNAAVAYRLLKEYQKQDARLLDKPIAEGIRTARNPGRLEQIYDHPPVYLDGAHNREGMAALREFLKTHYPQSKVVLIFSMMKDKEYVPIAQSFHEWVSQVYFVELSEGRALSYEDFKPQCSVPSQRLPIETVGPAFFNTFDDGHVLVICGSLYLVGAIKRYMEPSKK